MIKKVLKTILVLCIMVVSIFMLTGCEKNKDNNNESEAEKAYLQPLRDYVDGIINKDPNQVLKAFPEFMNRTENITVDDINEMYIQYESLYGANIKFEYEFGDATKLEEKDISGLEEQIKGYYTDVQDIDITEAYIVPLKLTVSGDGIKDENATEEEQTEERVSHTDTTDFYVFKYNENWYLI